MVAITLELGYMYIHLLNAHVKPQATSTKYMVSRITALSILDTPILNQKGKKKKTKQKRALQLTSSSKLYFYISATAASCTSILQSRQHPDSHPHMSVTVFQLLIIHNHTVVYIPFHIHKASTALIPDCKGTLFLHNDITPLQASIP